MENRVTFYFLEGNQEIIIALGPRGNKSESAEWGLVSENFDDQYVCTTGTDSRRMLKNAVQRGRSERGGEAYPCGTSSL